MKNKNVYLVIPNDCNSLSFDRWLEVSDKFGTIEFHSDYNEAVASAKIHSVSYQFPFKVIEKVGKDYFLRETIGSKYHSKNACNYSVSLLTMLKS